MNQQPLVSAIIIFLNGEQFIEEAIASIFAQSYNNWELLLVDDGSTDHSTMIAQKYAQKYPEKVFYLEHEGHQNKGMSASRNLGISQANGEYIGFLDADDMWLPKNWKNKWHYWHPIKKQQWFTDVLKFGTVGLASQKIISAIISII